MIIDVTDKYVTPIDELKDTNEDLDIDALEASIDDETDEPDALINNDSYDITNALIDEYSESVEEAITEATDFIPAWYIIKGADANGEARYVGLNPEHTSVRVITRGPYRINDMLFFVSEAHAKQFADKVIAAKPSRAQFNLAPEEYAPIKPMHNEAGYVQIDTAYGKAYIASGHVPSPRAASTDTNSI